MPTVTFPKLYGGEYAALPIIALPYLYWFTDFTVPAVLLNGTVVTAACGAAALWRSRELARAIEQKRRSGQPGWYRDRMEPIWPALAGLMLVFLAALQLIGAVSHISWTRQGPMLTDVFDR